jgi:hypothetical protein
MPYPNFATPQEVDPNDETLAIYTKLMADTQTYAKKFYASQAREPELRSGPTPVSSPAPPPIPVPTRPPMSQPPQAPTMSPPMAPQPSQPAAPMVPSAEPNIVYPPEAVAEQQAQRRQRQMEMQAPGQPGMARSLLESVAPIVPQQTGAPMPYRG